MVLGGAMPVGSSRNQRLDPLALPVRFTAMRCRGGRAAAPGRTRPRACGAATRGPRHAHGRQPSGHGVPGRRAAAGAVRGRCRPTSSPSRSSIAIPPCRCRCSPHPTATTWWPNGSCGRACSSCRCSLPSSMERCARHSVRSAACALRQPAPRRRRRNAVKARRPSILMRRQPKRLAGSTAVHRGEREIIARN